MSALKRALCAPALVAFAAGGAFAQDDLIGSWPVSAAPLGNPFVPGSPQTESEIELGAMLFWDTQLSADGTMACGTCHIPKNGGADSRPPGLNPMSGAEGSFGMLLQNAAGSYVRDPNFGFSRQVTDFSAPTVIASSFFGSLFWDKRVDGSLENEAGTATEPGFGAYAALEAQAAIPPVRQVEMGHAGIQWADVTARLEAAKPLAAAKVIPANLAALLTPATTYADLFDDVFGAPLAGDPSVDRLRVLRALGTYQRSLVPDESQFDLGTMTTDQEAGFEIFTTRATKSQFARTCSACHSTDLFHGFETDATGALLEPNDNLFSDGLRHDTGLPTNQNSVPFKTPTLRNVGLRQRFMHDGSFESLGDVIDFYSDSPDAKFGFAVPLSNEEKAELLDFLGTALTDPRVAEETGPFARPRLHSEDVPFADNHFGDGTDDAVVPNPVILANVPPFVGNAEFKVGVGEATPGATARIGIATNADFEDPWIKSNIPLWIDPDNTAWTVTTIGADGGATFYMPIPDLPYLAGARFYAEWFVIDPQAAYGTVASQAAEFIRF